VVAAAAPRGTAVFLAAAQALRTLVATMVMMMPMAPTPLAQRSKSPVQQRHMR
jgi:hypothetical protein